IIRSRPTASLMEVTSEQEYKLSLPEQREYLISIPVDPMFIIGKQLISALKEGTESANPEDIGKAMGNSVTEGTEKALGIESPSKVFMEIGRQLVAGLNRGLSGPSATVGAKGLAESVVKAFTQGVRGTIDATRDMGFDFLHDMSKNTVGDYKPDVKEITSFTEAIKDVIDEASSRVIPEGLARINKILEQGVQTPFGKLSTLADKTVTSVYQNFVNGQLKIMETWEGTPALFRDVVFKPILTDSTKALSQSLAEYKRNHNLVKMGWSDLVDWLKENPIKDMGELFGTTIVKISGNFANAISDMVMNVRWLRDTFVEAKNPIMNMLGDIIKELIRMAAQKAFLWIAGKIFGPGTMLLSTVSGFATGGFPDRGSLFVAREAGPELVGTIGNRSAVVNNDQIVEAVSQGVYEAVVSAMGGQSKSEDRPIEVRVTLDGKEITRTVEKYQSDRGVPIMPRGLMYGY
ncbi:MAG: hypothetical protein QM305_04410, partial [Bacteroidota bacterium]|nr:hypothetical protein [Bacteroidota bacterium]